ncbi:MAG TPA: folate-binding protein [Opitutaceae bacterium]|jgi:hypothetical protein
MRNFPQEASIFPYAPACVLRISGPDAATFLQGQFTNDLGKMTPGQPVYGLWLDRKGRVIADSYVIALPGFADFRVVSPGSAAVTVAKRLGDFIVADDVSIGDETAAWRGMALVGPGTGEWLAAQPRPGFVFPGRRSSGENWEWVYPEGESFAAGQAVDGVRTASPSEMERRRIGDGIPSVPGDIGPGEFPNEGGLDSVAISYSKGCYLGQEVMARLKTTGRVRRSLVRVRGAGPAPAVPAGLWLGGKRQGELRSAAANPDGAGFDGLALLSVATDRGKDLSLAADGPPSVSCIGPL